MGIFTRMVRLCKSDIHGVMDQLEDKGLLLKQYVRDMEEALVQKEGVLKQMALSRNQVNREVEKYHLEIQKLEQDLEIAIQKDKDAIARMLIKKLKPLTRHKEELDSHIQRLSEEITELSKEIEKQRVDYERVQLRSREYLHFAEQKQRVKDVSDFLSPSFIQELSEEEIELELLQRKEAIKTKSREVLKSGGKTD